MRPIDISGAAGFGRERAFWAMATGAWLPQNLKSKTRGTDAQPSARRVGGGRARTSPPPSETSQTPQRAESCIWAVRAERRRTVPCRCGQVLLPRAPAECGRISEISMLLTLLAHLTAHPCNSFPASFLEFAVRDRGVPWNTTEFCPTQRAGLEVVSPQLPGPSHRKW